MREAVANPDEHGLKFMGERVPFDGQELEESLSVPDVEGERAAIDAEFAPSEEEEEKMSQETGEPSFASKKEAMAATYDPEEEHLKRIMTSHNTAFRDAWSLMKNDLFTLPRCKGCGQVVGSVNEEGYCTYEDGCQPKRFTKAWNPNTQAPNDEPNKWGQTEPMPNPGIGEGQDWTWDMKWCKSCRAMYKPSSLKYDMGLCPDCERRFKDYSPSKPTHPDFGQYEGYDSR